MLGTLAQDLKSPVQLPSLVLVERLLLAEHTRYEYHELNAWYKRE